MFGVEMPVPRMTAWFGDAGYTYSGIHHRPASPNNSELVAWRNAAVSVGRNRSQSRPRCASTTSPTVSMASITSASGGSRSRALRSSTIPIADKESRQPTHKAFSVIKREGHDNYWLNIGLVFPHKDNGGFNIMLQAFRSTARSSAARLPRALVDLLPQRRRVVHESAIHLQRPMRVALAAQLFHPLSPSGNRIAFVLHRVVRSEPIDKMEGMPALPSVRSRECLALVGEC